MGLFKKNLEHRSDEELMSLLANGGQSAFDELYRRYSKPMLNFFYRLLGNDKEHAEDLLHDLFLKIIEMPERFDTNRTFRTWFYTLAGNMVRNEYRRIQIDRSYEKSLSDMEEPVVDGTERAFDRELFHQRLLLELERLEPEQKILFVLRFHEELTIPQIAEIMDCPDGTVKSRLFQLNRILAKKLYLYKPL
jgi:RNA polymerase sigma-70 factor (ECF subfamily)